MKKMLVTFSEIGETSGTTQPIYPKFVSPILNTINQGTQATRPKNVGQMTDLSQEFINTHVIKTPAAWKRFYDSKMPGAIQKAIETNAVVAHRFNIGYDVVETWVKDLIYSKTYQGLMAQEAIGKKLAALENKTFRRSSRQEEAKGIDGWLDDMPVSIKSKSYDAVIPSKYEGIPVRMIFYTKTKEGFKVKL
jgi:hypothetical protein